VQIIKEFEGCFIVSLGGVAFWREALGKPLSVCAVIINHVVLLHPFQPVLIWSVQLLWKPGITSGRRRWSARRCSRRPNASISFEVSVGSSKWGLAPVRLYKPASCRPVISIPKTGVYSHRLVLWECNTNRFWVLELSNGSAIDRESELYMNKKDVRKQKHKWCIYRKKHAWIEGVGNLT
jgi:hypothetical protein